ncbi:MAG TPA: DinB family protein [Terriglobales bacterium]|nr:DinB family protein [Terriglobales bacterium]
MPHPPTAPRPNLAQEMAQAFLVNDRMNQLLLEHLAPQAWRAKPPGQNVRTIADIFAHVHNIRRKWLRLSAPHLKLPAELDRRRCTQEQARAALAESALRCSEMLAEALAAPPGRAQSFLRDGWARSWRPGAAMFAYMITHDAHHRGQACMLAHQLGFRLPGAAGYKMWVWERLWKQCGFELPTGSKIKSRTMGPK